MVASKGAPKVSGRYERPMETTEFRSKFAEEIKSMLDGASVEKVRDVAENWQDVHDELVGKDGKGGVKKTFDDAVAKVLKGWTGDAADKFYVRAQKISKNLANGAPYAQATANAIGAAAEDLQKAITAMLKIDWSPPTVTNQVYTEEIMKKALQGDGKIPPPVNDWEYLEYWHDGKGNLTGKIEAYKRAKTDMDAGMSTADVLDKYEDVSGMYGLPFFLRQGLRASAVMEPLAKSYAAKAKEMDLPPPVEKDEIPPRGKGGKEGGGNIGGIGDGLDGSDIGSRLGGGIGSTDPGSRADLGAARKSDLPSLAVDKLPDGTEYKPGSQTGTGLESISSGGSALNSGGNGGLGSVGTAGVGSGAGLGTGAPGAVAGIGGPTGAGPAGVGGTAGRGGGRLGTGPSATNSSSGAGSRGGMAPGMGGAAGAGGAGAGKTGGSQRGLSARRAGGIVGRAGGGSAAAAEQGGTGLHRSRGATGAGGQGARGPGLVGAPGTAGGARSGGRRNESRPDYMAEDEETWVPKRNSAPRVIE